MKLQLEAKAFLVSSNLWQKMTEMEEPRPEQVVGQYVSTEGLLQLSAKALESLDQGLSILNLKLERLCQKKKTLAHAAI